MAHGLVRTWIHARHRHPLSGNIDPEFHSETPKSATCHGHTCMPGHMSGRSRRPIHICGSSAVLVDWADLTELGLSMPTPSHEQG